MAEADRNGGAVETVSLFPSFIFFPLLIFFPSSHSRFPFLLLSYRLREGATLGGDGHGDSGRIRAAVGAAMVEGGEVEEARSEGAPEGVDVGRRLAEAATARRRRRRGGDPAGRGQSEEAASGACDRC